MWFSFVVLAVAVMFLGTVLFNVLSAIRRERNPFIAVGGALLVLGGGGFFGTLLLAGAGHRLDQAELPNAIGAILVTTPDGHTYAVSQPTGRVQRYGPDGLFERGFFVETAGGTLEAGLTRDGLLAVCAARVHILRVYDANGALAREAGPCRLGNGATGFLPVSQIIAAPFPRGHVHEGWLAMLLLPLRHPALAWIIAVIGLATLAGSNLSWLRQLPAFSLKTPKP